MNEYNPQAVNYEFDAPVLTRADLEGERVKQWERDRLVELGVNEMHASLAAEAGAVDWHDVERLVARGCAPELAMEIAA